MNSTVIKKTIIILLCFYALFGATMKAIIVCAFSLQHILTCIIHYYPSFVCKNLFVVISMLISFGIDINIKCKSNILFHIVLFIICGYYLIEDIIYVKYEIGLYGIDHRLFVCYELLPCIIRVICYLYCMNVIIEKSTKIGDSNFALDIEYQ